MRTCVIGIGNELREDDGVGLMVVRELKSVLKKYPIELLEIGDCLFDIPEIMMNFDTVFILDALLPDSGSEMIQIVYDDTYFRITRENYSLHDMDLFWQLAYARRHGFSGEVILIGIATYSLEYRTGLSPELLNLLPEIILHTTVIINYYIFGPKSAAIDRVDK